MNPDDMHRETPVEAATRIAGDAWTALILREALLFGATRFEEFQRALRVNSATLSDRLERLVQAGLLERRSLEDPMYRGQGYLVAPTGEAYLPALLAMAQWGRRWRLGAGEAMLAVVHSACGATLGAEVRCLHCRGDLTARTVDVTFSPSYLDRRSAQVRQRAPRLDHLERGGPCPIARALTEIGDRWRMLILQQCFFGMRRFDDFHRSLGIAPNILSNRLQSLVSAELLELHAYQLRPRRHEYRLTAPGIDLYRVAITQWTWSETQFGATLDVELTHRPCGRHARAEQYCGACGRTFTLSDVTALRTSLVHWSSASPFIVTSEHPAVGGRARSLDELGR